MTTHAVDAPFGLEDLIPPGPCDAGFGGLATVARGTSQQNVRRVEARPAVLDLDDVVTVEANTFAGIGHVVPIVLASATTRLDDLAHQGLPFGRSVERIGLLLPSDDRAAPHRRPELMANRAQLTHHDAPLERSGRLL